MSSESWEGDPRLWTPRSRIGPETAVVTAGSCFAQHIARQFRARGFNVLDTEPAPPGMTEASAGRFGYGMYSARYGNLYTTRQLLQLAREAFSDRDETIVWERDGRFFDARRPAVEPDGLASADEVRAHRRHHLAQVRRAFTSADLFVFTMGLTETWEEAATGTVFPTAPGTVAGSWDPATVRFLNLGFADVLADFLAFRALMREIRPAMRFLLTVSPVPLTATATDDHVLSATVYSKSVLRAVAGELVQAHDDIDYFPSYEIVSTPFMRQIFYDQSLRQVSADGVATAMRLFFASLEGGDPGVRLTQQPAPDADDDAEAVVCEEVLLEGFAR